MGDKLGTILKKVTSLVIIFSCAFAYADTPAETEKNLFANDLFTISELLSVNKKATIYSINANEKGLSHKATRIEKPTRSNLRIYQAPSRRDKYILKVFDKDNKVISVMGLGDPFYIHVQHMGYEDSYVFGGKISRKFDIPIPSDINAAYISLNSQDDFGIKEVQKIRLN